PEDLCSQPDLGFLKGSWVTDTLVVVRTDILGRQKGKGDNVDFLLEFPSASGEGTVTVTNRETSKTCRAQVKGQCVAASGGGSGQDLRFDFQPTPTACGAGFFPDPDSTDIPPLQIACKPGESTASCVHVNRDSSRVNFSLKRTK